MKEEQEAALLKEEDSKKDELEAKLEKLLGALHAKVMAMMLKTEGLMGKSPQEVQMMYAKLKQKLLSEKLTLRELAEQEAEAKKKLGEDQDKIKDTEAKKKLGEEQDKIK